MITRTLPSREFCQHIRTLLAETSTYSTSLTAEAKTIHHQFSESFPKLFAIIELEEKNRPEMVIDSEILEKQDDLKMQIDETRKEFHDAFMQRERALGELETRLITLHQEILQEQNTGVLDKLNLLVDNNQLHLAITQAIDDFTAKAEAQSCCTRYIFCCFESKDVKDAKLKIKELKSQQADLQSKDPTVAHTAAIFALELKRRKLQTERTLLAAQAPIKMDETPIDLALDIDTLVEEKEARYYTSLSVESLFHVLQTYYRFIQLIEHLTIASTSSNGTDKTPLLSPSQLILDKCNAYKIAIDKLFNQFWCPDSYGQSAKTIFQHFLRLQASDRETILTKMLYDKVLPKHPVKTEEGSYLAPVFS
jgi:hypothetical protein